MLVELAVRGLGVIDEAHLLLGPGLTAVTGETGAGKTLLVEAIELLTGARADPLLVRPGVDEAVVEGRFAAGGDGEDRILRRVIGASRSRAYVDGRMASAATLAEAGTGLVDLHGQHAHQALLSPASQRRALDRAGRLDVGPRDAARRALAELDARRAALGGDPRARAREVDLLRFQIDEIDRAAVTDAGEDDLLRDEEERLADASAHRRALEVARDAMSGEGGALDRIGSAVAALSGRAGLGGAEQRLRAAAAEVADAADLVRNLAEVTDEDPERLAAVGARRHALGELRRKYGDTLAEVLAHRDAIGARLAELEAHEETVAALDAEHAARRADLEAASRALGRARRAAAGPFAAAVERRLRELALPRASFAVDVAGDDPAGGDVRWSLTTNPGAPPLPLSRVASGGELSRTMLAVRLALGPDREPGEGRTLVFDEVDAGIGGEAAVAVGRALAALADHHQVLVVTHLPQVAAFARHHVVVTKDTGRASTAAAVHAVDGEDRVRELSRMLSGSPDSDTARRHAEELLAAACVRSGHAGAR